MGNLWVSLIILWSQVQVLYGLPTFPLQYQSLSALTSRSNAVSQGVNCQRRQRVEFDDLLQVVGGQVGIPHRHREIGVTEGSVEEQRCSRRSS